MVTHNHNSKKSQTKKLILSLVLIVVGFSSSYSMNDSLVEVQINQKVYELNLGEVLYLPVESDELKILIVCKSDCDEKNHLEDGEPDVLDIFNVNIDDIEHRIFENRERTISIDKAKKYTKIAFVRTDLKAVFSLSTYFEFPSYLELEIKSREDDVSEQYVLAKPNHRCSLIFVYVESRNRVSWGINSKAAKLAKGRPYRVKRTKVELGGKKYKGITVDIEHTSKINGKYVLLDLGDSIYGNSRTVNFIHKYRAENGFKKCKAWKTIEDSILIFN